MIRLTRLVIVCVLAAGNVQCQRPQTKDADSSRSEASSAPGQRQKAHVRAIVINGERILLDSSETLLSVQKVLGKSPLISPQHGEDSWSICYQVSAQDVSVELRLQSNDIGGPDHTVLGFELTTRQARDSITKARCPEIRNTRAMVSTDNGLSLGMPVSDLLTVMGAPVGDSSGVYEYEFTRAIQAHGELKAYDITASLRAETRGGRVVGLRGWYVKTS